MILEAAMKYKLLIACCFWCITIFLAMSETGSNKIPDMQKLHSSPFMCYLESMSFQLLEEVIVPGKSENILNKRSRCNKAENCRIYKANFQHCLHSFTRISLLYSFCLVNRVIK